MIKIFSFVGSCAGENSQTARYSDGLAAAFRKKAEALGEQVYYKRVTGDQVQVKFCRSCTSCFKKGLCPLDAQDDMAMLKREFLESDIIFFGSPVYLWQMSGIAKSVIDRIAYWSHRCELAGKLGVAFAVTDSSYGQEVADNLALLLGFMGLTVVHAGYAVNSMGGPNLYLEEDMQPRYEKISESLFYAREHPQKFITQIQEQSFQTRQRMNRNIRALTDVIEKEPPDEVRVWAQRNIEMYPSLADYIRAVMERGQGK